MQKLNLQKKRSGATVIMISLIVGAIGISAALYALSVYRGSLRETTYNVQSNQAYGCAESAIDIAADCILSTENPSDVLDLCEATSWVDLDPESPEVCSYTYNLKEVRDSFTLDTLGKDVTEIISLNTDSQTLDISWVTNFSEGNVIELNFLTDDGSDGFIIVQVDYACAVVPDQWLGKEFETAGYNPDDKLCKVTDSIDVTGYDLVQITPRLNSAAEVEITITQQGGTPAPLQGYNIFAVGKTGGVELDLDALLLDSDTYGMARMINNSIYVGEVEN